MNLLKMKIAIHSCKLNVDDSCDNQSDKLFKHLNGAGQSVLIYEQ